MGLSVYHVLTTSRKASQSKRLLDEEVSLDLSRLTTTLNRLERSIQTGINTLPDPSPGKLEHGHSERTQGLTGKQQTDKGD
ncbi:hypothetical protein Tco_0322281 [Tanacetum coccineum]